MEVVLAGKKKPAALSLRRQKVSSFPTKLRPVLNQRW